MLVQFVKRMKKKQMFPHELIGEEIEITHSHNPLDVGKCGRVIDETKSLLIVDVQGKTKSFLKQNIQFRLLKWNISVVGKEIMRRPEERIKG